MNSTASEGRSASASAVQPRSRLQPPTVGHVLTAVEIEGTGLMPVGKPMNLAVQPRSLLALLIYSYAQGTLASHHIEATLRDDPQLRLLCHDKFPDWRQLRRFRRLNHGVVSNCLAHLLSEEPALAAKFSSPSADAEQRLSEAAILDELFAEE